MNNIETKEKILAKLDTRKKSAIQEVETYFRILEYAVRTDDKKELEFADKDWINTIFESAINLVK